MATKKTTTTKKKAATTSKARSSKPATTKKAAAKKSPSSSGRRAGGRSGGDADYAVGPPKAVVVEREIGGRMMSIETGRFARQADGAVVVRYGDTMVLATAQSGRAPEHIDFFPLTVDYREKTAAAGMIPGGFFKREGRPTTKEILGCRIIDRSIRPMFPDGYRAEVQVLSQVLATDRENDPDVIAAVASFAALAISSIPNGETLGMCRIGLRDGKLLVNPTWSQVQSEDNQLNLTVAGHKDAIAMVEAGAKEVSEDVMLEALELAHDTCKQIVELIEELVDLCGKEKGEFTPPVRDDSLAKAVEKKFGKQLRAAPLTEGSKKDRQKAIKAAKDEAVAAFPADEKLDPAEKNAFNKRVGEVIGGIIKQGERESILKGRRADGRDSSTIRPITIEVGVLPRVHGSVLFTRGETQALGIVTLGGTEDQQIIDGLLPEGRKRFLLHYNFPPFSVGEVKRVGSPGRREIGHGALAERGVEPVLPSSEEFPYTIRVTSEILESNGSSSMATACSATLAMMDAGVPIRQPVAGIAMGLVMEGKDYAILSDILGSEDACGDMDFKVVGTGKGITALQMDIKCEGLTREILQEALEQAREGRLHILRKMLEALRAPREKLSPNAPRLVSVKIPQEKIGLVIGPAGKNIRAMQEQYECKISIEDGGLCTVTGLNAAKVDEAVNYLKAMTAEVEIGQIYEGRVTAIKEFGAFVEILPGQEGLVHVSELSNEFIRSVTDVVRIGDTIKTKVIGIDDFGKVKLSRKVLLEGDAEGEGDGAERPRREDRGPRGRGRDRDDRDDRGPRGRGRDRDDRDDRGARGRGRDREDRGGWDEERGSDREERAPRGRGRDREDREERGSDREERAPRGRGRDREEREERGSDREERAPRGRGRDREERGSDREERAPSGRGRDREDREERGPRGRGRDRDGRGGWDEERGRDREERAPRGRGRDRDDRGDRAPRGGDDREERPAQSRRDGEEREDRPRRGRGRDSSAPFAEFDATEEDLEPNPFAGSEIGDLEEADSLFTDDREPAGSGRGSGRGPRRRRRR